MYSETWERTVTKAYDIFIFEEDSPPVFVSNINLQDAFYNGSYILRYFVKDDTDTALNHFISIDDNVTPIFPSSHLHDGHNYYYVFGKGLTAGYHTVYITVSDSKGQSVKSHTMSFPIPKIESHKAALEDSKANSYDSYKNDIVGYLETLISDQVINENERKEQWFCGNHRRSRWSHQCICGRQDRKIAVEDSYQKSHV